MKVIARNNGCDGTNKEGKGLKEGKSYDVIEWSYQDVIGHWVSRTDRFTNPKEPRFFIKVLNERGDEKDYWNDHFLSNVEIRDIKLTSLLEQNGKNS